MSELSFLSEQNVINKIYRIRGQKIMLDRDLAELYGVETKVLKQAVRRNIYRFPEDFMFEMTVEELKNWRSQFVTSNLAGENNLRSQIVTSSLSDTKGWGGARYVPFCFTEQGVAMLSSVLNSERAILVNIQIIRIFTKMREVLSVNKDILLKLERLEKLGGKHEKEIQTIFQALKQLLQVPQPSRKPVGFKRKNER